MTQQLRHVKQSLTRLALLSLSLLIVGLPASTPLAWADSASDCTPVKAAPSGIQKPTGADAVTYTYNTCTGLWSNPYYTWSPATKQTTPKTPLVYTYNSTSGHYDAQKWVYSPAKQAWYQTTISVDQPPAGAKVIGGPAPVAPVNPATTKSDASSSSANPGTSNQPATDESSGNAGENQNQVNSTSSVSSNQDTSTAVNLTNSVDSAATSGDASVIANTIGGSATTGNAQATATVINQVQTSSGLGNAVTFTANIDGDIQGDLLLDPSQLQPAQTSDSVNTSNGLVINSNVNGTITNNINLAAQSGNATVASNTKAGDATSGSATAIANVVNMMNSLVSAGQSFIGTININGNLNGNILVPQGFYDTLLASNAPRQTVAIPDSTLAKSGVVINNDQTITNNVTSTATSGTATSAGNTLAGAATSGSASTNVTIFDLTGSQIRDSNSLLVFVNVVGKWVGIIMDAPAGTTAVALGSGVTRGPPAGDSSQQVNASTTQTISNNINVSAQSGNATVSDNTEAGDATSGDAHTAVNVLNMTGSYFDSSNWFGILFINVFGNWYGNFGVAKAPPIVKNIPGSGTSGKLKDPNKPFEFVPSAKSRSTGLNSVSSGDTLGQDGQAGLSFAATHISPELAAAAHRVLVSQGAIKAVAAGVTSGAAGATQTKGDAIAHQQQAQAFMVGGVLVLVGLTGLGVEQFSRRRQG